jgi:hypothetical protein
MAAEVEKKKHSKRHSGVAAKTTLSEHEELTQAIEGFLQANTNFESSVVLNTTFEMLAACSTLQEVFTLALQRQILGMDGALHWMVFLSLAPARAEALGEAPFSPAAPFSAAAALTLITSVYDLGVAEIVDEHFDSESDSESEEETSQQAD